MNLKPLKKSAVYFFSFLTIFFIIWLTINGFNQIKNLFSKNDNSQYILAEENQLTASILNIPYDLKPIRDWSVKDFNISAKSAICVEVEKTNDKVLFKENENEKLSIASLTKLMTALIVLENYDLNRVVIINEEAIDQPGEQGFLKAGETFTVKNLLYSALMESNNDAAYSLAEIMGVEKFVSLMNLKALNLDLKQSNFTDPTGISPDNYSNIQDLIKLTRYLLEKQPLVWEILSQKDFRLLTSNGSFHHEIINTNELLEKIPNIVGGKTGQTAEAKGCLLLVVKNPKNQNNIIYVILGSDDRFGEMDRLINWVNQAYKY